MVGKIISATLLLISGCNTNAVDIGTTLPPTATATIVTPRPIIAIVPRDLSINKDNSYNDLFLDSQKVADFIIKEKLNDTLSSAMVDFYNARNYEYTWFSSTGLIEQSISFHSLYTSENDADFFNKSLENRLDQLRMGKAATVDAQNPSTIITELQITRRFIEYARKNYAGMGISPAGLGTYIPAKRKLIIGLGDSVLVHNSVNDNYAALNESYKLLKTPLQKYINIEKNGGWQAIKSPSGKYGIGDSSAAIALLKKRLQMTGELAGNDSSDLFNAELEKAVQSYQSTHGYKPSGIVTASLVKDMNIPALKRVQQLIINMQRMRWMPARNDGLLIIVNIPEFVVYVDSAKNVLFQMDAVVGAAGHNTTMFSGNLSQVVFSPYWNIPPSIVRKEVIPGMRREKDYLEKRHMEITGREEGLPVVRQRPGDDNALGKVKFLFPNSFNIYMHDTPEKQFFSRSQRGLSHGCVRLSDAPKLAYYLLRNSKTWTPANIDIAMASGHEQFVKLTDPVPVIITYYTAWVDNRGVLNFAGDIYGHDKQLAEKMFSNAQ